MATEIAVEYVSLVVDGSRVRPGIVSAMRAADPDAERIGRAQGERYSRGFAAAARQNIRGVTAGIALAGGAFSSVIRNAGTAATVIGLAARAARHFSVSLLASATLLRSVAGVSLARLAIGLRLVAAVAGRVATQVARVTSAILVLQAVARVAGLMTNFARTLSKVTIGAALAVGVIAGLGSAFAALAATVGAAAGAIAAAAVGILAPALAVLKVGFSGLSSGAKAWSEAQKQVGSTAGATASAVKAIESAKKQQAKTFERGNREIVEAEKRVVKEQQAVKRAQDAVNKAREEAKHDAEGYARTLRGLSLDEESARLAVEEARKSLRETAADKNSDQLDIWRANLGVREAEQAYDEIIARNRDQRAEITKAQQAGIEGSEKVVAAKEDEQAAQEQLAEAQADLTQTQKDVVAANLEAAEAVADAYQQMAEAGQTASSVDPFEAMVGARMAPMLAAAKALKRSITDTFSATLEPSFVRIGGLLEQLTPPLTALSGTFGVIGNKITESLASPATTAAFGQMVAASDEFFTHLTEGGDGLGALTSGLVQFAANAATAFSGVGENVNSLFERIGEKLASFTPDQIAGSLDTLKAVFENIGQVVGPLVPLFTQLGAVSAAGMAPGFIAFGNAIREATPGLVEMAKVLMPALGQVMANLAPIIPAMVQAFTPWAQILAVIAPPLAAVVTFLAPMAPLLLTVVLAVKLMSAAVAIYNAAMVVFANYTKIATAVQWLWNAALAANPIGIVVAAVAALAAGLYLFFTRTETGRKAWAVIWSGIKASVSAAWDFIKPIFTAIGSWFTDTAVPAIMSFWHGAVEPAWAGIQSAVSGAWGFLQPILSALISWFTDTAAPAIMNFWHGVIEPAWSGIGAVIRHVWDDFVQPVLHNIGVLLGLAGDAVTALWRNVVEPAFSGIGSLIKGTWDNILKPSFEGWKIIFEEVLFPVIRFLWDNVVKPVFEGIGSTISTVWDKVISPIFDRIKQGIGLVGDAFGAAGRLISTVWDGIKTGLRPTVHAIGRLLTGIPEKWGMWEVPGAKTANMLGEKMLAFRDGGPVRGRGTGTSDSILARVSNGEFIEPTRVVNSKTLPVLEAIRRGWVPPAWLLHDMVPGFAGGGLVQTSDSISGVQQGMWDVLRAAFPDAVLTSATRTADVGSGYDYHMQAKAIDIAGPNMPAMAAWIAKNYPGSLELIHSNGFSSNIKNGKNVGDGYSFYGAGTMAGHADHVHWAMASAPAALKSAEPQAPATGLPSASSSGGGGGGGGSASPGGPSSGGGVTSSADAQAADATRVFVVNWPQTLGAGLSTALAQQSGAGLPGSEGGAASLPPTDSTTYHAGALPPVDPGAPAGGQAGQHPFSGFGKLPGAKDEIDLFSGPAPWFMAATPEQAFANLGTQAADMAKRTGDDFRGFLENNWKEMVQTGAGLVGMGATGGGGGDTYNFNGMDPNSSARAVERVQRRRTMAQQRHGGFGR